jgi:hypothetical protein
MRIDIIYGESKVGKTTLCKSIQEACFLDIGNNENFRKISMIQIFKNLYDSNSSFDYFITEACLLNLNYRNKFLKEIQNYTKAEQINVFYLHSYKNINESNIIKNCNYGKHYIITFKDLNDRINFIKNI